MNKNTNLFQSTLKSSTQTLYPLCRSSIFLLFLCGFEGSPGVMGYWNSGLFQPSFIVMHKLLYALVEERWQEVAILHAFLFLQHMEKDKIQTDAHTHSHTHKVGKQKRVYTFCLNREERKRATRFAVLTKMPTTKWSAGRFCLKKCCP